MRWSILILLLLISPVWAATEHYYVDEEEEAHPFRDGTGTYGNPVELDEILVEDVEIPVDDDNEPRIPAHVYKFGSTIVWNDGKSWLIIRENSWASLPDPELTLTLPSELLTGNFISKDTGHRASVTGGLFEVEWSSEALTAHSGLLNFVGNGTIRTIHFHPDVVPSTRGVPLSYKIIVKADPELEQTQTITQDVISRTRQEYHDMGARIPTRGGRYLRGSEVALQTDFLTNFNELQRMYSNWVTSANKNKSSLRIHSSTRKPGHNHRVGGKWNSLHQYGCAYDLGPIKDLGGATGILNDQKQLQKIWRDSLNLGIPNGYTYIKGNTVHVQIYRYTSLPAD